jgi:DnaK suppressor protein
MNETRARELVGAERARIESMLAGVTGEIQAGGSLQSQQKGEYADAGSTVQAETVALTLEADLRRQLVEVARAEQRIDMGTYGRSVESGAPIPDARLEVEPLAERTVEEQTLLDKVNRR